jgi:DNA-binding NtrC family response regulator
MKKILLCSGNPILIKSLYGVLRDDGHDVDIIEHPALAVQKVMAGGYGMMIVDSEPFGLSAEDAVQIIKSTMPDLPVLYVGSGEHGTVPAVDAPVDLEKFKRTVHSIAV